MSHCHNILRIGYLKHSRLIVQAHVSRDVKYNLTSVAFQIFTDEKIIIQIHFTLPLEAGGVLAKYCDDRDGMSVRSHI